MWIFSPPLWAIGHDSARKNSCLGKEYSFEGVIEGVIMHEMHGKQGFGYDPLFKPKNYDITFAQMSTEEKSKISHRGLAVNKLVDFLSANTH